MKLEEYILNLLKEEEEKDPLATVQVHPNVVASCLNKWRQTKPELSEEEVTKILKTFLKYVVPKLSNGFNQPEVLTFFLRHFNPSERFFPNVNNTNRTELFKSLYDIKYTKAELVLKNPGAVKALGAADKRGEKLFTFGNEAKRDANGDVILKQVIIPSGPDQGKFKQIPAEYIPTTYNVEKMKYAYETLKNKEKILEPYISVMNDPNKYSLTQMKFILDEFDQNLIQLEADAQAQEDAFDLKDLRTDDKKVNLSKKEAQSLSSPYLLWSSEDGKIRLYDVPNQAASIKFGYYFGEAYRRLNVLTSKGLLKNAVNCKMQWCVTNPSYMSYYSSYRSGSSGYKFYLLVNDNYNFMALTDEQIAQLPENSPLRDFQNLKHYGNMISLKQSDANGKSNKIRVVDLRDDESDADMTYDQIEKFFPGFTQEIASELMNWYPYSSDEEFVKNSKTNFTNEIGTPNYIGAQSQSNKENFIKGTEEVNAAGDGTGTMIRGTILNAHVWRTLSDANKEKYIKMTEEYNASDKFKVLDVYYEILSDRKYYNQFLTKMNRIKEMTGSDVLAKIRANLLKDSYVTTPWRYSVKSPEIHLLQKKNNMDVYNLINTATLTKYTKDSIEYDGDYVQPKDGVILIGEDGSYFIAEKYSRSAGYDGPDTFWIIYDSQSANNDAYFINNREFNKCIEEGIIDIPEDYEEGNTGSIQIKKVRSKDEVFENKKGVK